MKKFVLLSVSLFTSIVLLACNHDDIFDVHWEKSENRLRLFTYYPLHEATGPNTINSNLDSIYVFSLHEQNITIVLGNHLPDFCQSQNQQNSHLAEEFSQKETEVYRRLYSTVSQDSIYIEIWPFNGSPVDCPKVSQHDPLFSGKVKITTKELSHLSTVSDLSRLGLTDIP